MGNGGRLVGHSPHCIPADVQNVEPHAQTPDVDQKSDDNAEKSEETVSEEEDVRILATPCLSDTQITVCGLEEYETDFRRRGWRCGCGVCPCGGADRTRFYWIWFRGEWLQVCLTIYSIGSLAAAIHSSIGNVTAGSLFAVAQSVGARAPYP